MFKMANRSNKKSAEVWRSSRSINNDKVSTKKLRVSQFTGLMKRKGSLNYQSSHQTEISEENFQVYKETFECFCHNKGDTVLVRKLEKLLHCVGYNPTIREMREYMGMLETQDPDEMNFDEFIELMKKIEKKSGPPQDQFDEIVKAFKKFDTDGSGYLERAELKKLLCKKGVEDVNDSDVEWILAVADENNDGKIDYEEFSKHLTKL